MADTPAVALLEGQSNIIFTLSSAGPDCVAADPRWMQYRFHSSYFSPSLSDFFRDQVEWYRYRSIETTILVGDDKVPLTGMRLVVLPHCAYLILEVLLPGTLGGALLANHALSWGPGAPDEIPSVTCDGLPFGDFLAQVLPAGLALDPRFRRGYVMAYLTVSETDAGVWDDPRWTSVVGMAESPLDVEHLTPNWSEVLQYQKWVVSRFLFSRRGTTLLMAENGREHDYVRRAFFTVYRSLAMLALYQHHVLVEIGQQLNAIPNLERNRRQVNEIHRRLLDFTKTIHLSEVTQVDYGQRLWGFWQEAFNIQGLYDQTAARIQEIDGYLTQVKNFDLTWKVTVLTAVGVPIQVGFSLVGSRVPWGWPTLGALGGATILFILLLMDWPRLWDRLRHAGESRTPRTKERS
jgi:hypothetical protein